MIITAKDGEREFRVTMKPPYDHTDFKVACSILQDNMFPEVWEENINKIRDILNEPRNDT